MEGTLSRHDIQMKYVLVFSVKISLSQKPQLGEERNALEMYGKVGAGQHTHHLYKQSTQLLPFPW